LKFKQKQPVCQGPVWQNVNSSSGCPVMAERLGEGAGAYTGLEPVPRAPGPVSPRISRRKARQGGGDLGYLAVGVRRSSDPGLP